MGGETFEVEVKVAAVSRLVQTILAAEVLEVDEVLEIPLPNVKTSVLAKVVEFCQHYRDEPMGEIQKPLRSNVLGDSVDEWYAQFVNVPDPGLIYDLIKAANYMDIEPLLNLSCALVACTIKGKTVEDFDTIFETTEEVTEEE